MHNYVYIANFVRTGREQFWFIEGDATSKTPMNEDDLVGYVVREVLPSQGVSPREVGLIDLLFTEIPGGQG